MNSTLILFKEIGRQLLIVGLVLGSLPMAIRILWKLRLLPLGLLLCGNETLLVTLGGSTPNSLHPAFYRLHPVFCRDMDCPLRP